MSFENLHNYANYAFCDARVSINPIIFLCHMNKNLMLFTNVYGFMRFYVLFFLTSIVSDTTIDYSRKVTPTTCKGLSDYIE